MKLNVTIFINSIDRTKSEFLLVYIDDSTEKLERKILSTSRFFW